MKPLARFERVPIESREPIHSFALIRLLMTVTALLALSVLGFPYGGEAVLVLGGAALPWSIALLLLARRDPDRSLSPLIPAADIAILGVLLWLEPEIYGQVHFVALFMVAAHAHFQGEQRGLVIGAAAAVVLIPVSLATDVPVKGRMLEAYEAIFAVCAMSSALVVGALRTAESSGRLRARELSRRTIDTESGVRRQLAEAIHDGPLQELSSVELMLASAEQSLAAGDVERGRSVLAEARALTRDNVTFLRDEIVQLGPHAFEELSFEQAISDCIEVWERRYGFRVRRDVGPLALPSAVAGPLFRITQEAVANAGKHASASLVTVRLSRRPGEVVLEVEDDGGGFGDTDPLGAAEPGHIGLASMRERAEMLGGELAIDSGDRGTVVRVVAPL